MPETHPIHNHLMQTQALSVRLGGKLRLTGVDLTLKPGECLAVIGPNGAGKSTLLECLSGDREPDSGEIRLRDRPLADWSPEALAQVRAVLPQRTELTFPFTVREVVAMGLLWPKAADAQALLSGALTRFALSELAERVYPTLSGGEQQRAQLARVWLQFQQGQLSTNQPGLVILDEPLAHLDMRYQRQCLQTFQAACRDANAAVVMVLHDLQLAAQYADRLLLLDQGEVRAEGAPSEVLKATTLQDVYQCPLTVLTHPGGWPLVVPGD
ncbi:MAG: heme ABC transporter ATP-binding protein [Hydrogenovibrio sp.]|uniref:heme ABC transporter ATP-binding protein n=1 Tax=Hydrogenovibrio sp. TaxID=2065821 RepID=UPI0028709519|nr:heme ABC transporter ATP-binding protein [Hydrogenovibrio sp.]MDR9498353.1 heme ABC transporter ATP-binding protein [Hydrogenovibrio sp.]